MFKTVPVLLPLLAALALGPALACGQNDSTSTVSQAGDTLARPPKPTKEVLATVNGTPIWDADVRLGLSGRGHGKEFPAEHRKNILEVIIRRELIRQRAVELGLDANPRYREKLRQMEAQIDAFKRRELSELFWRDIARSVEVSDAEAKTYFSKNAGRIRSELHVWQILSREEAQINRALESIEQGTSFEEVAKKRFPNLPRMAGTPWDLGYLRWKQVPESWRSVAYDLKNGEVSGIIRGPNKRFWIIKLIDKRENPDITFESIKPSIVEVLKSAKIERLREQIESNLRAKASIVYPKGPAGESE